MKKLLTYISALLIGNCLIVSSAYAICPLCTVAVAGGVGLAEWLGIDDTITGLWIGGFVVSIIIWLVFWLDKKDIHFKFRKIIVTILSYALIVAPLYPFGLFSHPLNTLWGVNKLLLGIIIGSVAFFLGGIWYFYLKKRYGGHAYFPFQKVVMPVAPLIVLSIVFYFITS
ncbi:MAG: hypothetical protein KAT71_06060 [Gammaproteobacteria bacterium]|nr:hypothetical protein [Gammaproteobacteria bacterium]